jgi:hypothetical protein
MELHRLGIIGVEGKVQGIGCASSTFISERTQAIWGSHERELNVEFLVVAGVEIDGLAAIFVFTKFRKLHRLGREIGGALDSERHCLVVIYILGGSTLSKFFCWYISKVIMGLFKDCGCGCNGKKQENKLVISIISGLTFFIVANPETFRLVRRVLGPRIATPTGCPSTMGLLVHTLVFILIVWGMMNLKKERKAKSGCGCGEKKVVKKGEKVVTAPPVLMVEVPEPTPNFGENQVELVDSGRNLAPMSLDSAGVLF